MAALSPLESPSAEQLATLEEIQRRVLWLAVRMVDHANSREGGEVKVGGHQASCASMVSIMTALWFAHIGGEDKVAVKPHASPLYHAIKYLTGELDRSYLTTLRQRGGLQAYPSRTKDPDVADFSTGSVGLGAVAPLFSATTRRFVDAHFGARGAARFIATVGDAELDEGNVWEAIADPAEAEAVRASLARDASPVIEISLEQVGAFAGNALELRDRHGYPVLLMSRSGYESLGESQVREMRKYWKAVHAVAVPTLERIGGGSVRCCVAELF